MRMLDPMQHVNELATTTVSHCNELITILSLGFKGPLTTALRHEQQIL